MQTVANPTISRKLCTSQALYALLNCVDVSGVFLDA
jgi:hypothetical protein